MATTVTLYEGNGGGLYLERAGDDYASGRRVCAYMEYSGNLFGVDAAALAADLDAWDDGVIGSLTDEHHLGWDGVGTYDVNAAMDNVLANLDDIDPTIAVWNGHRVEVVRHPSYAASRYLFGALEWQGRPISDWSLDALSKFATYAARRATRDHNLSLNQE